MEVVETQDGSSTVVSSRYEGELYHSDRGAIGESMHVYTRFLFDGASVLEIGFGSGLNALLSLGSALKLRYTTVELYPIDMDTVEKLSFVSDELRQLHSAPWGEWRGVTDSFEFKKLLIDIEHIGMVGAEGEELEGGYDIVFFDAFAPDVVPQQWSEEVFVELFSKMNWGAKLVTYSAKGVVKRALRAAGFEVKREQGALGKHNMVVATKLIDRDLNITP